MLAKMAAAEVGEAVETQWSDSVSGMDAEGGHGDDAAPAPEGDDGLRFWLYDPAIVSALRYENWLPPLSTTVAHLEDLHSNTVAALQFVPPLQPGGLPSPAQVVEDG